MAVGDEIHVHFDIAIDDCEIGQTPKNSFTYAYAVQALLARKQRD